MSVSLGYVIFYVPDVPRAVDFYVNAFGLEQKMLTPEDDYGELATGAVTLAFASEELAASNLSSAGGFTPIDSSAPAIPGAVTLLTLDVGASLSAAVEAGATVYVEPIEKPWGQTVAYVRDPFGLLIELATPVAS